MKDASILGNLRGMLVDEIHGLRIELLVNFKKQFKNIHTIYS